MSNHEYRSVRFREYKYLQKISTKFTQPLIPMSNTGVTGHENLSGNRPSRSSLAFFVDVWFGFACRRRRRFSAIMIMNDAVVLVTLLSFENGTFLDPCQADRSQGIIVAQYFSLTRFVYFIKSTLQQY